MKRIVSVLITTMLLAASAWSAPQSVESVRQFTFNHSLWDHAPSPKTNTGYWVGEFAAKSGTKYAWNGQFGFMDHTALPPSAQLGSTNSDDVWVPESRKFGKLKLDSVVIMPPNFVWYENPKQQVTFALRVIDYVAKEHANITHYIYEHWPEAEAAVMTDKQWDKFKKLTNGEYHDWFVAYQDGIIKARPDLDVRMIPVGPVISDILNNKALKASQLAWSELYEDNSPHGTTNLYFLAALVTYQAMFGQKVTDEYKAPGDIHSLIGEDFIALNDFVWQRLQHYNGDGVRIWP